MILKSNEKLYHHSYPNKYGEFSTHEIKHVPYPHILDIVYSDIFGTRYMYSNEKEIPVQLLESVASALKNKIQDKKDEIKFMKQSVQDLEQSLDSVEQMLSIKGLEQEELYGMGN